MKLENVERFEKEVEKEREVSEESPLVLQDASPLCNEMPLWGRSTFKSGGPNENETGGGEGRRRSPRSSLKKDGERKKRERQNLLTCSSVAHPMTFSTPALLYHDRSKMTISPELPAGSCAVPPYARDRVDIPAKVSRTSEEGSEGRPPHSRSQ